MSGFRVIPTRYKGSHFRSRIEARWAVYFDHIGLIWEYEKEGFELPDGSRYLPDFWLPQVRMWAEVKPEWPDKVEIEKARLLAKNSGFPVLFLDGQPRNSNFWSIEYPYPTSWGEPEEWMDYFLDGFYLREGRFYCCTGEDFGPGRGEQTGYCCKEIKEAVGAALSARFEFGESGRT